MISGCNAMLQMNVITGCNAMLQMDQNKLDPSSPYTMRE